MEYKKHQLKNVTKSQLVHIIDEYVIGYKSERNRVILKRRLCDGLTYEELSEEFDLSVNQVKNIIYKEMDILIKYLEVEV